MVKLLFQGGKEVELYEEKSEDTARVKQRE